MTVPMLKPTVFELSGPTAVSVAVTVPVRLAENWWVMPPFATSVPVKVSVVSTGGVGVVGVVLLSQAAPSAMNAHSSIPRTIGRISSPAQMINLSAVNNAAGPSMLNGIDRAFDSQCPASV
jgi:hypothetical protein